MPPGIYFHESRTRHSDTYVPAGTSRLHGQSVRIRFLAVKDTIQEQGLTFNVQNDFCGNPEDLDFVKTIPVIKGETGIICANDSTAAVLMSSLEAIGHKIASDLLICGFDDMKYSRHLKCSLTSFIQPCKEIANTSIDLMIRRIKCNDRLPMNVYLNGQIIKRDSTRFI